MGSAAQRHAGKPCRVYSGPLHSRRGRAAISRHCDLDFGGGGPLNARRRGGGADGSDAHLEKTQTRPRGECHSDRGEPTPRASLRRGRNRRPADAADSHDLGRGRSGRRMDGRTVDRDQPHTSGRPVAADHRRVWCGSCLVRAHLDAVAEGGVFAERRSQSGLWHYHSAAGLQPRPLAENGQPG